MTNKLDDLEDLRKKFIDLQLRNENLKKKIDKLTDTTISGDIKNIKDINLEELDFSTANIITGDITNLMYFKKIGKEDMEKLYSSVKTNIGGIFEQMDASKNYIHPFSDETVDEYIYRTFEEEQLKQLDTLANKISDKNKDELNEERIWVRNSSLIDMEQYNKFDTEGFKEALEGIKESEGKKDNNYKLPMSKLFTQFPRALQALVLASYYGHNKYKDTDQDWLNYKRVKGGSESYFDADIRHQLDKEIYGEKDKESGLPHIFHELFDKMAKCELYIIENNINIKDYAKNYLKNLQSS